MDRFFFHFSFRTQLVRDAKGREFSDLATAHRHAMLLIQKAVLLDDTDWRGWAIRISDSNDRSILSVLFPRISYFRGDERSARFESNTMR
jgi:hypothetical protein